MLFSKVCISKSVSGFLLVLDDFGKFTEVRFFSRLEVSVVAQSCLTLCDPMDCSPPVSSVRGIILARVLEWLAIYYSRQSSLSRGCISCDFCIDRQILYPKPPGKPIIS